MMGTAKMNGCHTTLASTSLLLELNGQYQQLQQQRETTTMTTTSVVATNANNVLTRDYSKFPYREFLK